MNMHISKRLALYAVLVLVLVSVFQANVEAAKKKKNSQQQKVTDDNAATVNDSDNNDDSAAYNVPPISQPENKTLTEKPVASETKPEAPTSVELKTAAEKTPVEPAPEEPKPVVPTPSRTQRQPSIKRQPSLPKKQPEEEPKKPEEVIQDKPSQSQPTEAAAGGVEPVPKEEPVPQTKTQRVPSIKRQSSLLKQQPSEFQPEQPSSQPAVDPKSEAGHSEAEPAATPVEPQTTEEPEEQLIELIDNTGENQQNQNQVEPQAQPAAAPEQTWSNWFGHKAIDAARFGLRTGINLVPAPGMLKNVKQCALKIVDRVAEEVAHKALIVYEKLMKPVKPLLEQAQRSGRQLLQKLGNSESISRLRQNKLYNVYVRIPLAAGQQQFATFQELLKQANASQIQDLLRSKGESLKQSGIQLYRSKYVKTGMSRLKAAARKLAVYSQVPRSKAEVLLKASARTTTILVQEVYDHLVPNSLKSVLCDTAGKAFNDLPWFVQQVALAGAKKAEEYIKN